MAFIAGTFLQNKQHLYSIHDRALKTLFKISE